MTFAVHNLHAPAVEITEDGKRIVRGEAAYQLPAPLFTQPTFDEAEAVRLERLNDE
jgi:hypothetical protein